MGKDKAIVHSLHIRTLVLGLSKEFQQLPSVQYIVKKCIAGEKRFNQHDTKRYQELYNIFKRTGINYSKFHGTHEVATDTFMTELYYRQRTAFNSFFKLKDTKFTTLFNAFGNQDSVEGQTFEACDFLIDLIDKEFELEPHRQWIAENQRRFNERARLSA